MRKQQAFTYIELLVTLAIMAVLFVPVMQLFSHTLYATSLSRNLITAVNLAKWEMERIKNLNATQAQWKIMGDELYPPLDKNPMEMNGLKWRIRREIIKESTPLEVRVAVFQDTFMDKPVITLVTLLEDMTWNEIRVVR